MRVHSWTTVDPPVFESGAIGLILRYQVRLRLFVAMLSTLNLCLYVAYYRLMLISLLSRICIQLPLGPKSVARDVVLCRQIRF